MSHKMSVRKIKGMAKGMVNSVSASMGIGGKAKKPKCAPEAEPKEPAFEKTFRKLQTLLDQARVKFHTDSQFHLCAAIKALDLVEKRYSRGWVIHQKKSKAKQAK